MGVGGGGEYPAVIEVARTQDGSFEWTDLTLAAGRDVGHGGVGLAPFPALTSGFTATGWGRGSRRVYYTNTDGAVMELATDGERWSYRNFTSEIAAPAAAWNSPLALCSGQPDRPAVYYVAENGGLTMLVFDGGWRLGVNNRLPRVAPSSPLAAMQSGRGRFAYYLDERGHLREVEAYGLNPTQSTDLTDFVQLPAASPLSGLAAVGWGEDSRRVYYANTDDDLIEMGGFGEIGNKWWWHALARQGARKLRGGSPLTATAAGTLSGMAQCCQEGKPLWMGWRGDGWTADEIYTSRDGTRPVAAANSSLVCGTTRDRLPWVSFVREDNHLGLWRGPGSDWSWWDLTADLSLPPVARAAAQGPLAFADTERGPCVYYLTDDPAP
ncbi:hypothetical protein TU94_29005 [Streptomyces cyaneogriseus subsp. noncyanogenus]|uniref:Uncharacterized protein n=2 Tax=Streptomyces cyaneogriseus TaxID=68192 RepID=A0A0C5FXT0_9ACTN|nr:hypothetical protein TU94_29005 [Streptomyces cyaneogriseus subsp. noncyanogenus]